MLVVAVVAAAGVAWCMMGLMWVRRIDRKFKEQINVPWAAAIARLDPPYPLDAEPAFLAAELALLANVVFPFYSQQAMVVLKDMEQKNPWYWWRHWNDDYSFKEGTHADR